MAKIDELVIQIKADTQQLKKELKQIEGKIRTTGAVGGAAFGGMAGAMSKAKGGAIILTGALVGIGAGIAKIAQVGSQFEDLKDSLDQVFGSIEAGDSAMQKVFTFAQTTPFQIEDATKAFIALKSAGIEPSMDMLQTFADTASVSVDQLGTFEALIRMVQRSASGGMGLEELNMISDRGIDVLGILGDKLNLTKVDIAKFGKTAEGAAEMVKALTEGLNEKFGGAMEAKMDNLSTKSSNMVIAFKQLADEVFKSKLADTLKNLTDRLTDFANEAARAVRIANDTASLGDMLGDKTGKTDALELPLKLNLAQDLEAIAFDELNEAKQSLQAVIDAGFVGQETLIFRDLVDDAQKNYDNYKRIVEDLLAERSRLQEKPEEGDKPFAAGDIEGLIDFQTTFKKLVQDTIPETQKLQTQIDYIKGLMDTSDEEDMKGIMAFLGVKDASELQNVVTHLEKVKKELEETGEVTDELALILESAADQFANDFINALQDGENALVSFRNLVGDMIQQVIAEFLKMKVIKPMMNALFTAVGLPTIPMDSSAGGGTIQGGRATLVGERGPEIFVPNTGGTIMNNMNSKNALGGGTPINIYQNLNFATGVVPTVRAEVTKMMPQIAEVTKSAVQESAMRGGTFRRSLVGG